MQKGTQASAQCLFEKGDDAMTNIMTPSGVGMTDGQIEEIVSLYRDLLKKYRNEIGGLEEVQLVLGSDDYIGEVLGVLRRRVAMVSNMIRCVVKVDRTKTAAQMIEATGRYKWYINEQVLAEMPTVGRAEDTAEIFELDYDPTVDELDREYEARNLRPDPLVAMQVVIDDPTFADERPFVVQWRDKEGRACFVLFNRRDVQRRVYVYCDIHGWDCRSRFVGVRK